MFLSESRLTVLTGCHDAARGIDSAMQWNPTAKYALSDYNNIL